jgi:hypothetical protein
MHTCFRRNDEKDYGIIKKYRNNRKNMENSKRRVNCLASLAMMEIGVF